ncbi:MAG: c-type cytochrome [Rubrivivax sp.]
MARRLPAAALLLALPLAAVAQPDGATLFGQHCAPCHQPDGSGTVGLAPPLKGEHWVRLAADRGYLPTVLVHGLAGPIRLAGGQTFVGSMPAFGAQLDDATLAAMATHVRRLQGGADAPYTADEVKAERTRPGSPPQTRTRRLQALGG